jgi:hypothetical protein
VRYNSWNFQRLQSVDSGLPVEAGQVQPFPRSAIELEDQHICLP